MSLRQGSPGTSDKHTASRKWSIKRFSPSSLLALAAMLVPEPQGEPGMRSVAAHTNAHKHTNTDVTCLHCLGPDGMCLGPCVLECGVGLVERGSVDFVLNCIFFSNRVSFGHHKAGELARHSSDAEARVRDSSHACRGHGVLAALLQPRAPGHGQVVKAGGRHLDTGPLYTMYVYVRACVRACVGHTSVSAHASGHGVRSRAEARVALLPFFSPPSLSVSPFKMRFPSTAASRNASA